MTPRTNGTGCRCETTPSGTLQEEVQLANDAAGPVQEAPLCVVWLGVGGQRGHLRPAGHRAAHEVHLARHCNKTEGERPAEWGDEWGHEPDEDVQQDARREQKASRQRQRCTAPVPHSITKMSSAGLPTEKSISPALQAERTKHGVLPARLIPDTMSTNAHDGTAELTRQRLTEAPAFG